MMRVYCDESIQSYFGVYEAPEPFDNLLLLSRGNALCEIKFLQDGDKNGISFGNADVKETASYPAILLQADRWLSIYFKGTDPGFLPAIAFPATGLFTQRVWNLLMQIPYGKHVTYGELAKEYCAQYCCPRMSAQAIGNAVGKNPFCIMVPCHRVIGADGSITGYAGGQKNKAELLKLENIPFKGRLSTVN